MNRAEQINRCAYTGQIGSKARKYLKQLVNRAWRRAGKRDPADAPQKRKAFTWGWS